MLLWDEHRSRPWALVRRLRFGDECWYRAVTPEADPVLREKIGYSRDLRALVMHAYKLYLRGYAANTGPINGWARAPDSGRKLPGD